MPKPTAEDVAKARATIAAAETADSDPGKKALVALVSMKEFAAVDEVMRKAQALNPANIDLSYAISMIDRLRSAHTPA